MQALILTTILAVTCFPFLISRGWVPSLLNYVPELLSLCVLIYVVTRGVESRFKFVRPAYWVIFAVLLVGIVCGALVNQLGPGQMFAGLRNYLRAIPFFFLPAVLLINERHIRAQLLLLTAVCVLQFPLAWAQRMETIAIASARGLEDTTGDNTVGTLITSGGLTLFQIAAACVLTGFYVRRFVGARIYLILLLLILLPTTLNETKITLFLLPIALLTTVYVGSDRGRRIKNSLLGIGITAGFLAIFVPIYDFFMMPRWGYGLFDFFMMEGRLERYLMKGTEIGDQGPAGRVDGMIAAVTVLTQDPVRALFGLGIGNASDSALGPQFVGAYYRLLESFPLTSVSYVVLELGLLGLVMVLWLHWLIFRDSLRLAQADSGFLGALAVGWAGVSVIIVVSLLYTTSITSPAFAYLYWYFSGVVAAFGSKVKWGEGPPPKWAGTIGAETL